MTARVLGGSSGCWPDATGRFISESAAVTLPARDLPLGLGGGRIELSFELPRNALQARHHVTARNRKSVFKSLQAKLLGGSAIEQEPV